MKDKKPGIDWTDMYGVKHTTRDIEPEIKQAESIPVNQNTTSQEIVPEYDTSQTGEPIKFVPEQIFQGPMSATDQDVNEKLSQEYEKVNAEDLFGNQAFMETYRSVPKAMQPEFMSRFILDQKQDPDQVAREMFETREEIERENKEMEMRNPEIDPFSGGKIVPLSSLNQQEFMKMREREPKITTADIDRQKELIEMFTNGNEGKA